MKKLLALCLTAVLCLCCLASCGIFGFHSISYQDADTERLLMDGYAPKRAKPGDTVVLRTGPIMDADLYFYVNGVNIENTHNDSDYWEYVFTMPDEDVVITSDIVGGGPAPTNHFLRNQAGIQWLNEITAEDIAEIKIISEYVGVAPGNLKNIQSSTDEAVIARIFEEYYWLDTAPIPEQNGQISGGSAVTVKFLLKDGTEKELYINNGNYRDTGGNYFELLYIPNFEESDNATEAYGFISYTETCEIRCNDAGTDYSICEIPIDELVFVVYADDFSASGYEYPYFIKTDFGTFDFVSNNLFVKIGDFVPYQLVGKNLEELIAEYSATTE